MVAASLILAALAGLCVGSFLNVVAWRVPRGESIVSPPSACPACGAPVKPYDNIPVLSWLLLRAKCRSCKAPISVRYPAIELVTALLYVAVVAAKYHHPGRVALGLGLVTLLVPMTVIDLEVRLIPNRLLAPFAAFALLATAVLDRHLIVEQLIAGAAGFAFFLVAALAKPGGMGMGDVKLAGVLGLYLGRAVAPAIFIGLIAGVVIGVVIMARKGIAGGRKTAVPFGPFLALGGLIAFFAGDQLVHDYTSHS